MFNKVILIGRLGQNAEAKTAQNNKEYVTCGEMFYSAHHASHDYSPSSPHTIDTFRKAHPQAQH